MQAAVQVCQGQLLQLWVTVNWQGHAWLWAISEDGGTSWDWMGQQRDEAPCRPWMAVKVTFGCT